MKKYLKICLFAVSVLLVTACASLKPLENVIEYDEVSNEVVVDVDEADEVIGSLIEEKAPDLIKFLPYITAGLFLFRKRPRTHIINAVKSLLPVNGVIDLKGFTTSVAKAAGLSHSSTKEKES